LSENLERNKPRGADMILWPIYPNNSNY